MRIRKWMQRRPRSKFSRIIIALMNAINSHDDSWLLTNYRVSQDLPSVESIIKQVDVQLLESSNWSLGARYVKKQVKGQGSPSPGTPATGGSKKNKKDAKKGQLKSHKKKKKTGRLPRNYNPNVLPDPERWLPKYERSSYKRRVKGKKEVIRGTQGSASVDPEQTFSSTKSKTAASSTSPSLPGPGPRKNKPPAARKGRKK